MRSERRRAHLSGCRSVSSSCVSSSRRAALRYSFSSSGTMDGTFSRYLGAQAGLEGKRVRFRYLVCTWYLIGT